MVAGPCGAWVAARHNELEFCSSTGTPLARTRVAAETQRTCTQGEGVGPGRVKGQPATVAMSVCINKGWPLDRTRTWLGAGTADTP